MSYAVSAALQSAIFAAVSADINVVAVVGDAVYDAIPSGVLPSLYISLGSEVVREQSDKTGAGTSHQFVVSVVTDVPGFRTAKEVAGIVCDVLEDADLTLTRGRLVSLQFRRARAFKIDTGAGRQIDLTFRARIEDN